MNSEADDVADLNEEKSIETKNEVNVVGEALRSLSFRERLKTLLPHRRPLKDQMKDKTVSYVNLLRPRPPSSKMDDEKKSKSSRRLSRTSP